MHDRPAEEISEDLVLYALGLLEGESETRVRSHLEAGCAECAAALDVFTETAAQIGHDTPLVAPPPNLREKVLARVQSSPQAQVWKSWEQQPSAALHVVRSSEGTWHTVAPGVHAKKLYVDTARDMVTMMIRMEPGATYSAHRHGGSEQCLVIEGDIHDGIQRYYAGDYQCASKGSRHDIQSTENGCTLLIVSSLHDELFS